MEDELTLDQAMNKILELTDANTALSEQVAQLSQAVADRDAQIADLQATNQKLFLRVTQNAGDSEDDNDVDTEVMSLEDYGKKINL